MICHNKRSSLKSLTACCFCFFFCLKINCRTLETINAPDACGLLNTDKRPQHTEAQHNNVKQSSFSSSQLLLSCWKLLTINTFSLGCRFFFFLLLFYDLYDAGSRIMMAELSAPMLACAQLHLDSHIKCINIKLLLFKWSTCKVCREISWHCVVLFALLLHE